MLLEKGAPLEIHGLLDQWESEPQTNEQTTAELLAELIMIGLEYSWRQHDPRQTAHPLWELWQISINLYNRNSLPQI